jgi:hypothetical protein
MEWSAGCSIDTRLLSYACCGVEGCPTAWQGSDALCWPHESGAGFLCRLPRQVPLLPEDAAALLQWLADEQIGDALPGRRADDAGGSLQALATQLVGVAAPAGRLEAALADRLFESATGCSIGHWVPIWQPSIVRIFISVVQPGRRPVLASDGQPQDTAHHLMPMHLYLGAALGAALLPRPSAFRFRV